MEIDVLIEDARWKALELERLAVMAAGATLEHLGVDGMAAELSVLACDDAKITELNGDFREKPSATNVLSWPAKDLAADMAGDPPRSPTPDFDGTIPLGDIAIAYETCVREAEELGKPVVEHVTHLIVHGVLHLLGYDHIRDPDATLMQGIEADILGKLGYNDPYSD